MNPHVKSLCILGTVMALGLWNCEDSTSAVSTEQNFSELTQPGISSNSELPETSSDSAEDSNLPEATSPSLSDSMSNTSATSSATGSATVYSSSTEEMSPVSSSDTRMAESSSEVAKPASSAQTKPAESSSSEAKQPMSSSSSQKATSSSSSKTVIESSSSATQSVKKSVGCGKSLNGIKTGYFKINVNGTNRDYAIDIPNNYDPNKPYRLFYTSHWFGGSAKDVVKRNSFERRSRQLGFLRAKAYGERSRRASYFHSPLDERIHLGLGRKRSRPRTI